MNAGITRRRAIAEVMLTGGATLFLYPISWLLRRSFGLESAEYETSFFFFYLAYVINDPHFAVTYLLFYRDAKKRAFSPEVPRVQRARWIVSGVVVPIVLVAWGIYAIRKNEAQTLGWMVQLMYLLVGWHYVKQGFGVLTVLSARRGVKITPTERRATLFHAFAGWAFAWASPVSDGGYFEEKGLVYRGVAHPQWLMILTGVVLGASSLLLVGVIAARKIREGKMIPLGPLLGLLISIWSWMIFSGADPLVRYAIPALHSIQYLFFVYLLNKNKAKAHEGPPSFGRPASVRVGAIALASLGLGWFLFHGAPEFLDLAFTKKLPAGDVDEMGPTPIFAALFTYVNLHHYFMDHVIWRRENPETKYLQDAPPAVIAPPAAEPERLAA
ncbi:MAG: hypothetical protein KIT84_41885 [Labilithrix sp.]|nr:hypothetical protein [Labilithrix sp.]MCW5817625.1 hypothetical protein [Labilithrix sp.]